MKRSRQEINAVIKTLLIEHGPISRHDLAALAGVPHKTMRRDLSLFRASGFQFHIAAWFPVEPIAGCPVALLAYGDGVNAEQPWGIHQESREKKSSHMARALEVFESNAVVSTPLLRAALGVDRNSVWMLIKQLESDKKIHAWGRAGNSVLYALGPRAGADDLTDFDDDDEVFAAVKVEALRETDDQRRQTIARISKYTSPFAHLLARAA